MTLVVKGIKSGRYFYFQTSSGTHQKPVTTYITRTQTDINALSDAIAKAVTKHFMSVYQRAGYLSSVNYRFLNPPSESMYDNQFYEYLRFIYKFLKENLQNELQDYDDIIFAKYVHGSNAIEGNSLTRSEVFDCIIKNKSPLGKTENELLQTRNHFRTKQYLDDYDGKLTESFIKEIHKRLMSGVDGYNHEEKAGVYRSESVIITKGTSPISRVENIPRDVLKLLSDFEEMLESNTHPVNCFAIFHHQFEQIHPFRDGNGRTGRAILDYMLKKYDFPPIYIPPKERNIYLDALHEGGLVENYTPLVDFITKRMGMTVWYYVAKSPSMRKVVHSQGFRDLFVSRLGVSDVYQEMMKTVEHFETNEEDP
jgi:fido (protein-threonine AMPylation protein)